MNKKIIAEIFVIGNQIGLKEKPIIISKDLLFIAGYFKREAFTVHISEGLINKDDFLSPCIVMQIKKLKNKDDRELKRQTQRKIQWLELLLKDYNKNRKEIKKEERLTILVFDDFTIRLDFGNQTNQNLRNEIKKLPLIAKKKKMKQFFKEFKLFKLFLIESFQ